MRPVRLRAGLPLAAALWFASVPAQADVTKEQCIAANGKAQDLRRGGKLFAAREQLRLCANPACPALVRDDCTRRLDELEKAQPTIVFEPKDGTGKDLLGVRVSVDGKLLAENLDGTALTADPGAHDFLFEVAGQAPVSQQFVLHEGEKGRTERIVIGPAMPVPAPSSVSAAGAPAKSVTPTDQSAPAMSSGEGASPGGTKRVIGVVVGGVGIGLLGLATYYQATALSRDRDSDAAAASADPSVRATAHTIYGQASQAQTDALILGGIGVASIGVGLFLVLTSGSTSGSSEPAKAAGLSARPFVGARCGGVSFGSSW